MTRFSDRVTLLSVSIHAPAWARPPTRTTTVDYANRVSIHAPVWARRLSKKLADFGTSFNPRAREGATVFHKRVGITYCMTEVSIHAPVWARPKRHSIYDVTAEFEFQSTRP